jgi:hypothetical protein
VLLLNLAHAEQVDQLTHALRTSRQTGIGVGVLVQIYDVTRERALQILSRASQKSTASSASSARTSSEPEAYRPANSRWPNRAKADTSGSDTK